MIRLSLHLTSISIIALLLATINYPEPDAGAAATTPKTIKVITANNRARLCPSPGCGSNQEIARVATGTKLKVEGAATQSLPNWDVTWYKVKYKGKQGYVSEYDTEAGPNTPKLR